jgi:hypothetical protein
LFARLKNSCALLSARPCEQNVASIADRDGVGFERLAGITDWFSGFQAEFVGVQGANDAVYTYYTIGQWPHFVGACGLGGKYVATARAKDDDDGIFDLKIAPLANRYSAEWTQVVGYFF